jgi:hypothetical protein
MLGDKFTTICIHLAANHPDSSLARSEPAIKSEQASCQLALPPQLGAITRHCTVCRGPTAPSLPHFLQNPIMRRYISYTILPGLGTHVLTLGAVRCGDRHFRFEEKCVLLLAHCCHGANEV